jgi:hypothetical protein
MTMTELSHAVSLLYQALKVLVADEKTVAWLEANNPKALNRSRQALVAYLGLKEEQRKPE